MKLHLGCSDDLKVSWVNVDIAAPPAGSERRAAPVELQSAAETWRTPGGHVYQQADLNAPWPWDAGTVDEVVANDVFEHIGSNHWGWYDPADGVDGLPYAPKWKRQHSRDIRAMFDVPGKIWCLNEAHRVLKPGGLLRFTVPCVMLSDGLVNPGAFCDPTHRTFWTVDDQYYYSAQFSGPEAERGRFGAAYGITALFSFPHLTRFKVEVGEKVWYEWRQLNGGRSADGRLEWRVADYGLGAERRARIHACIEAVK